MGNQTSQLNLKDPDFAKFVHFAPAEIRDWSNSFKTHFPTGKISLKEFEDFYSKLFPFGKVHNFCERLFKNINISQSTCVDINEILIAFTILLKGSKFEKLRWIFRFYDNDNDGFVSKEDLESGFIIVNELTLYSGLTEIDTKTFVEDVFNSVENQSGFLTLNDFELISAQSPEKLKSLVFF